MIRDHCLGIGKEKNLLIIIHETLYSYNQLNPMKRPLKINRIDRELTINLWSSKQTIVNHDRQLGNNIMDHENKQLLTITILVGVES